MKQILFTIFGCLITVLLFLQAPMAFNYQGVARDLSGNPIANQNIGLQISLLQFAANGPEIYKEMHNVTTTDFGLFNLSIGRGILVNGNFDSIEWGNARYFLQIEMDITGGSNYLLIGTSELLSVPYALYANNGSKWKDAQSQFGLNYSNVIIGIDRSNPRDYYYQSFPNLVVNNAKDTVNPHLVEISSKYKESNVIFDISCFPNSNLTLPHLRNSVLLRAREDAENLIISTAKHNSNIIFETSDIEAMRINSMGNIGMGTLNPKSKLNIANGDIYIENFNNGVIMKSPNGQCWRMTVNNSGKPEFNSIICPN